MRSIAPAMAGESVAPAQQAGVELIEAGERWGGQLDVARSPDAADDGALTSCRSEGGNELRPARGRRAELADCRAAS